VRVVRGHDVDDLAVLKGVVAGIFHEAVLVEIDGDNPLLDDVGCQEGSRGLFCEM
jgi:hypothetical protein